MERIRIRVEVDVDPKGIENFKKGIRDLNNLIGVKIVKVFPNVVPNPLVVQEGDEIDYE